MNTFASVFLICCMMGAWFSFCDRILFPLIGWIFSRKKKDPDQ